MKKPFSRLVPFSEFPKAVEIWSKAGKVVKAIADLPSEENVPMLGVPTGPRAWRWNPAEPATVAWAEALDGGDLRNKVPQRDKVVVLKAPFGGEPTELVRVQERFQGIGWTEKGVALVSEFERAKRTRRVWALDGGAPRKVWELSAEDRYKDPGTPVGSPRVRGAYMQVGETVFLSGAGASDKGDRPFLDRFNVKTFDTERLFQCESGTYESVAAVLSDDGRKLLTRFETPKDAPNYFLRDLTKQAKAAVTAFVDPAPQLAGVERQFITYDRKDGVKLSATLYLPPGYKKGDRLPVVMWAYPTEFTDPRMASQVSGSPYRFTTYGGRLAHVLPDAGLRCARQPDDADRGRRRDGQRHVRRAVGGQRPGGRGQGRRDGRRRSGSRRCGRAQLRRVHDGEPACALAHLPGGHRAQRARTTAR